MRDPYEVLGMSRDSDPDALRARYNELKAKYGEQRFQDGEVGNEGARLLSELESAWAVIEEDIKKIERRNAFGGDYGVIENLIKSGSYDEAQAVLDSVPERDGKWHYYQSIIFYKRDWLSESRAQLVLALQLDPGNARYRESLRKIDMVMGNAGVDPQSVGTDRNGPYGDPDAQYRAQQAQQQQANNDAVNTCANCMLCYCLSEMCCSMSRCCG